jgi:Fe-S cluster assembly ATPase SufC
LLKIDNLHAEIDGKPILKGLSFTVNVVGVEEPLAISSEGGMG